MLAQFEQLRAFFERNELLGQAPNFAARPRLRVIVFPSLKQYGEFRLRPNADAYYVSSRDGSKESDYIVMTASQAEDLAIEAHEYAHSVLHAAGFELPAWLDEGLSDLFSTIRVTSDGCRLGGVLPSRMEALTHRRWLPLPQLLALPQTAPLFQARAGAEMFYAESWALTDMLVGSPDYAPRFRELLTDLNRGTPSAQTLPAVYGRSLNDIAGDLERWVRGRKFTTREFPALPSTQFAIETLGLSNFQLKEVLAGLLFADGALARAETLYAALDRQKSGDPNVLAALGAIDLRRGDRAGAIEHWRRAMDNGLSDAGLCYRYAQLSEDAGLPAAEISRALERAVALDPSFDDARYRLALMESNSGDFEEAVKQLRAIRTISHARAYGYWSALSYAYMELGQRGEAKNAGEEAVKAAQTPSDRARATQLIYVAETDVAEQFITDAQGHSRLAETRVPHGTTDWNPFIEPTDHIRRAAGQLQEVLCSGGKLTGFVLDTAKGQVTVTVPDPQHVLMRNGPTEFSCGSQQPKRITVEYAADGKTDNRGVLRGIGSSEP
jgi:tetratricopeptide (TPR) repeat protein